MKKDFFFCFVTSKNFSSFRFLFRNLFITCMCEYPNRTSMVALLRIQPRRYTIVISSHVLRRNTTVYGVRNRRTWYLLNQVDFCNKFFFYLNLLFLLKMLHLIIKKKEELTDSSDKQLNQMLNQVDIGKFFCFIFF